MSCYADEVNKKYYVYINKAGKVCGGDKRYANDKEFLDKNKDVLESFWESAYIHDINEARERLESKYQAYKRQIESIDFVGPEVREMYAKRQPSCTCSLETFWRQRRCVCRDIPSQIEIMDELVNKDEGCRCPLAQLWRRRKCICKY